MFGGGRKQRTTDMYEKFSGNVERVIKLAEEIAREYDMEYVGTEHVLLAIQREGTNVGAQILARHGITGPLLKNEIDRLTQKSMEDTWVFGRLPGTPHFKNVVAIAIEQARQLESKDVRSEHLLLALLRESGSVAYQALRNLGLSHEAAVKDVLAIEVEKG